MSVAGGLPRAVDRAVVRRCDALQIFHDLPVFDFPETRNSVGVLGRGETNAGVFGSSVTVTAL